MIEQGLCQTGLNERFEVLETVSESKYSSVLKCRDRELDRLVAVKVSALTAVPNAERQRLVRELHVSCKLRHPALASAFDGLRTDQHVVLIMPWLDGGTLLQRQPAPADLASIQQAVGLVERLCHAIAYVHGSGIIHGDIKPDNVLLDDSGNPQLADFGSCQSTRGPQDHGQVIGTAAYLAPEIVRGESTYSVPSDLYALGATLFTILCGRPAFEGDDAAVLQAVRTTPFPDAGSINPAIPKSLRAIIHKACAAEPDQRYQTADELSADLNAWLQNRPLAAQPPSLFRKVVLWRRRHRLVANLITALAMILLIGTLSALTGWSRATATRKRLETTQTALAARGAEARRREAELQSTLTSIEAEQTRLQTSLDEEAKYLSDAQQTKQRSQQLAALAQQRLHDAEAAAESLRATKQQIDSATVELQTAEQQSQSLQAFTTFKQQRIAFNEQAREALQAIDEGRPVPAQWSSPRKDATEIAGMLPQIIRFLSELQSGQRQDGLSLPQLAVGHQMLSFAPTDDHSILWMNNRGLRRINLLATERRDALAWEPNQVVNQMVGSYVNQQWTAIRLFPDSTFVLRQHPQDGNIEAILVSNQAVTQFKKLWSCRAARGAASPDTAATASSPGPLTPYLLDVGTDPQQHLVFLSTESADPSVASRTFLHSLDLRPLAHSEARMPVKTLDLGMQVMETWPHSLQLSEHLSLGIGVAAVDSDSSQKYKFYRDVTFPWLRIPVGSWQAVGSGDDQPEQTGLERLLELPKSNKERWHSVDPYFSWGDGRVLWIHEVSRSLELNVFDCVTNESLRCRIPRLNPVGTITAASPLRDRWLYSASNDNVQVLKIADMGTESPRSVESFERYLPRLQRQIYQAADKQRRAVRFENDGSQFVVDNFLPDQNQPWTFDVVCRVDKTQAGDKSYRILLNSDVLGIQVAPGGRIEVMRHKKRDDGSAVWLSVGTGQNTTERWLRVTACWDGHEKIYQYIDGHLMGTRKIDESLVCQFNQHKLLIGLKNLPATIDAVRARRGVCHTESFEAPPNQPLQLTEDTVLLFQFDEGQGKTSQNAVTGGPHAQALQPQWVTIPTAP